VVSDDGTRAPIDPISDAGVNPGLVNFFIVDREIYTAQISDSFGEGDPEVLSMWLDIVADAQAREIDGQGLPPSIYEGYPDLEANRLYYEYAARIIVGEWDISRFDEFVDRWYETGGNEVTQRARDFYALVSN
jgi:putative aldouronate transport system substrate-binding protein